jgi:hypothetical protein
MTANVRLPLSGLVASAAAKTLHSSSPCLFEGTR